MAEKTAAPGLERALLGLLRDRPMHAYEMYRELAQAGSLGMVWRLKQSHLYALLGQLEAAGYVAGVLQAQGRRPPRRVLHLTEAGREAFARWLREPVAHGRDFRLEFLAKLYFAGREGAGTVEALLAGQRAACGQWLDELRRRLAALPADRPFDRLVLRFRMGQIEAIVVWLDDCGAAFTTGDGTREGAALHG